MSARGPMYYDTLRSYYRTELGVRMVLHVKRGGYTEIVATGGYSDAATVWDHTVYASDRERERDLRNWLRRHARWAMARERGDA
jgi:hypothetical protein